MRNWMLGCLAMAVAATAGAQEHDPDHMVMGSGTFPAGWQARFDKPDAKPADVKFVTMGPGMHVTSGPAAIYFDPARSATGNFEVTGSFAQSKPSAHPEAYGIFLGGSKLDGPDQSYLYFIVRQDGKYMIRHRAGAELHTVAPWTASEAVHALGTEGGAENTLTVRAAADSLHFLVNGTQVMSTPRTTVEEQMSVNGMTGIRVNHNLDVHVGKFAVVPIK